MFGTKKLQARLGELEAGLAAAVKESQNKSIELSALKSELEHRLAAADEALVQVQSELSAANGQIDKYRQLLVEIASRLPASGGELASLIAAVDPAAVDDSKLKPMLIVVKFYEPEYGIGKAIADLAAAAKPALSDYFVGLAVVEMKQIQLWPQHALDMERMLQGRRGNDLDRQFGPKSAQQVTFEGKSKGTFEVCCAALTEFVRLELGIYCGDVAVVLAERDSGQLHVRVLFAGTSEVRTRQLATHRK